MVALSKGSMSKDTGFAHCPKGGVVAGADLGVAGDDRPVDSSATTPKHGPMERQHAPMPPERSAGRPGATPADRRPARRGGWPHEVLRLQRLAGNAATTQVVQRDGDPPAPDNADDGPPPSEFAAKFQPDDVVATMAGMGLGAADLVPNSDATTAQALATSVQALAVGGGAVSIQRDPPPGADTPAPKAGSAGDVLSALSKEPAIKDALERLKQLVLDAWDSFKKGTSTPEKVVTFTIVGAIVGGGLAGAGSDPNTRRQGIDLLNGAKLTLPVPGLNDSLSVTPKTQNGQLQGGTVNLDVLKLFPQLRKVPGLD
jgi:hypothetical protein